MADTKSVKTLIVDDQPLYSRGVSSLLDDTPGYTVIGEASSISDAFEIIENQHPALVIIEINLGHDSGMDLISRIKTFDPKITILVLSANDERFYSERSLNLGARGYIMKDQSADKVLEAIQTVLSGKTYLSASERERLFDAMTAGENQRGMKDWVVTARKLSDREFQVFSCIGKGLGTIEIANKFQLSTKTIDTHKEHIKLKLHCNSSQELRQLAIEWASQQNNT